MRTALFTSFVLFAVPLSASPARAWNDRGHMVVAAAAYAKLTPAAKRRAAELLALNPQHATWVAGVPHAARDEVAFTKAATWADFIKGASGYRNDGERPTGPDAARNIGYRDKLQHRYWHYVNLPFSPDGTKVEGPLAPNVETQIETFRAALAAPSTSDDVLSYDLAWLLHLVGDVHQPLHSATRFDRELPQGDRGGNEVKICQPPCHDGLHGFWDGVLGASTELTSVLREAGRLPAPNRARAALADPAVWTRESFELATTAVYVPPVGVGAGPFSLTPAYRNAAKGLARAQMSLAAARLAALLNAALR